MTDLSFDALAPEYEKLWATCTVLPSRKSAADLSASRIIANKARYVTVEQATTVPWIVVGLIHATEGGLNFGTHLHNGDSLQRRTVHVPKGRPKQGNPPFTWEESAIDALTMDGLDKVGVWSPERLCFELERYNGTGYLKYHPNVNTPYLWSGTNNYTRGKYVADGQWDPNAVSGQSGAIAILKCAMVRDTEVADLLNPPAPPDVIASDSTVLEPSTADLIDAGELAATSRKVGLIMQLRNWAFGVGAGGTGLSFADFSDKTSQLHQIADYFKENAFLLLIGGCVVGFIAAQALINWHVQDYNQGRYIPSKSPGA
jgi:lysozyme family protein